MNARSWNYLRVRGEYSSNRRAIFKSRELPPRARRILHSVDAVPLNIGTTSACAENTLACFPLLLEKWNYLRVRGEYRFFCGEYLRGSGTTSACAENTRSISVNALISWNYLRVRGEYCIADSTNAASMELPPRARRILALGDNGEVHCGTTSACAENTLGAALGKSLDRNYLRVRGEYSWRRGAGSQPWELPPRARRIQPLPLRILRTLGTTSACAENTLNELGLL